MQKVKKYGKEMLVDAKGHMWAFGRGGLVVIGPKGAVAEITVPRFKLAAPDFSDLSSLGSQKLKVTLASLPGILDHLKVPPTIKLQKRLKTYLDSKLAPVKAL